MAKPRKPSVQDLAGREVTLSAAIAGDVQEREEAMAEADRESGSVFYNDTDPYASRWLRNLMRHGLISEGIVDERSITEIRAEELVGYTRCHFFAGIAGWEYALALAGWPQGQEVWTGSCPCQPFSAAGKRQGEADERHLWPAFYALISERRPATIFGEQVASTDGRDWLAGVRSDLEGIGYAFGAVDLPAASVGAPHIRQRFFWVAARLGSPSRAGREGSEHSLTGRSAREARRSVGESGGAFRGLANREDDGCRQGDSLGRGSGSGVRAEGVGSGSADRGDAGGLADADGREHGDGGIQRSGEQRQQPQDGGTGGLGNTTSDGPNEQQGERGIAISPGIVRERESASDGDADRLEQSASAERREDDGDAAGRQRETPVQFGDGNPWSDFYLIPCRDGKLRRVGCGVQPLAHGIPAKRSDPRLGYVLARLESLGHSAKDSRRIIKTARGNRVGRLRGYGNAIVSHVAALFIRAFLESQCPPTP